LARRLGVPHVELDAIHWGADWTPAPVPEFRKQAEDALCGDAWTADGNYSVVRDIVWGRADTVVWLDYSLPVIIGRVVRRTFRRTITREVLWNENRERLADALASRDSIVLWALRTYRRRRREYPMLFGQPEYAHLNVVHFRTPGDARSWLESF